jgi:ISXO2-like transposase domain
VHGILDRDERKIRATVVPDVIRETLQNEILNQVEFGAKLYSDDAVAYNELASLYAHDVVNHALEYVKGRVHTNGMENFWSLLKRGLHGTYVAVEPFHLFRYVDEQAFRYNRKDLDAAGRFSLAVSQMVGKAAHLRGTHRQGGSRLGQLSLGVGNAAGGQNRQSGEPSSTARARGLDCRR